MFLLARVLLVGTAAAAPSELSLLQVPVLDLPFRGQLGLAPPVPLLQELFILLLYSLDLLLLPFLLLHLSVCLESFPESEQTCDLSAKDS